MVAHVAQLVRPTPLPRTPLTEDAFDCGAQRLGAVDHEQPPLLGVQSARHQVREQLGHYRRVLGRPLAHSQQMLLAPWVDPQSHHHVMLSEANTVDIDDQNFQPLEAPLAQRLELVRARREEFAADRRARNSHRLGHLRQHFGVAAGRNSAEQISNIRAPVRSWALSASYAGTDTSAPIPPPRRRKRIRSTLSLRSDKRTWPGWRPCQITSPSRRPRCGAPATCCADSSSTASMVARPVTSISSSSAISALSTNSTNGNRPCPFFVSQCASARLSCRLIT